MVNAFSRQIGFSAALAAGDTQPEVFSSRAFNADLKSPLGLVANCGAQSLEPGWPLKDQCSSRDDPHLECLRAASSHTGCFGPNRLCRPGV